MVPASDPEQIFLSESEWKILPCIMFNLIFFSPDYYFRGKLAEVPAILSNVVLDGEDVLGD